MFTALHRFELDYLLASVGKPYVVLMDGITSQLRTLRFPCDAALTAVQWAAASAWRQERLSELLLKTRSSLCQKPRSATAQMSVLAISCLTWTARLVPISRSRGIPCLDVTSCESFHRGVSSRTEPNMLHSELGFATHYIPSRRIPALLERLASLETPSYEVINDTIEECSQERDPDEPPPSLIGAKRVALDTAFGHNTVEEIVASLKKISEENEAEDIRTWANATLTALDLRSPTSLKVALTAVRKGKDLDLKAALQMEMGIATAFCVCFFCTLYFSKRPVDILSSKAAASPDFATGVTAVVGPKEKRVLGRPAWSPGTLDEVQDAYIEENFFSKFDPSPASSPAAATPSDTPAVKAPTLAATIPYERQHGFMEFSLPTEKEIRQMVTGEHPSSGMTVITREELVKAFIFEYRGKMGVKEKVLEVASRCCVEEPDKETNNKWLRWKGPIA